MAQTNFQHSNHLLLSLPPTELERWTPELELVELKLGQVLYESRIKLRHAYFPVNSIISLLYLLENGESTEISVIGNEGFMGSSLLMGGHTRPGSAIVQKAGECYRISANFLKSEFSESLPVAHLLMRYTQALMIQITQTAVCNRHHTLDQQLCKWLLVSIDRLTGKDLVMTQELIANMLGVRREGVTEAAGKLQTAGLISYSRGKIKVVDRKGLEKRSCECYQVVKTEYDRLLPDEIAV